MDTFTNFSGYHNHAALNNCKNKPITHSKSIADSSNDCFTNTNLTYNSNTSCYAKLDRPKRMFYNTICNKKRFVLHQLITLDESTATGLDKIFASYFSSIMSHFNLSNIKSDYQSK